MFKCTFCRKSTFFLMYCYIHYLSVDDLDPEPDPKQRKIPDLNATTRFPYSPRSGSVISVADLDPGIRCLFDPWILDP